MKKKFLNATIASFLLFCSQTLIAQTNFELSYVIKECPSQELPFNGAKNQKFIRDISYPINNANGILLNKLYMNIQLTDYYLVKDNEDVSHTLFRKFSIPNSSNYLLSISMGGVTDYRTDILIITPPEGKVLDQMYGDIGFYFFRIRECRVSKEGKVYTYQLIPTESTSVDFGKFKQFNGYREDKTFEITADGKFKEVASQKYQPQTYLRTTIENKAYHIWNGTEVKK